MPSSMPTSKVTYSQLLKCRDELQMYFCCKLCKKLPDKPEKLVSFCECLDVFCNECISTDVIDECPICKLGSLDVDLVSNQQLYEAFEFMLNISVMEENTLAGTNNKPCAGKQLQTNLNGTGNILSNMPKRDRPNLKSASSLKLPFTTTYNPTLKSVMVPPVQSVSTETSKQHAAYSEYFTIHKDPSIPSKLPQRLKLKRTAPTTNKLADDLKSAAPSPRISLDTTGTNDVNKISTKLSRLQKQATTRPTTAMESIKSNQIILPTDPNGLLKIVVESTTPEFVYSTHERTITAECESNFDVSSNKEAPFETPKRLIKSVITPKSIHKQKRNIQGETLLITSCRKGDTDVVNALLCNGDDVNAQDNAKWTPLHEAAHHGFVDIVEKLLDYGALVNVPGGPDSVTPLYDAVVHNRLEVVKLLIQRGADRTIRNSFGLIPSQVAPTEEIKEVLRAKLVPNPVTVNKPAMPKVSPGVTHHKPVVILNANLVAIPLRLLKKIVKKYKWKLAPYYSAEVTHIVTATQDGLCVPTFSILCGILQGKWILREDWLKKCDEDKDLALNDPQLFEVVGTTHFGYTECMKRARFNSANKYPGLFFGCHIFVKTIFGTGYTVDKLELSKDDLKNLIQYGEGSLLSREPDPESIPQQQSTVPFHSEANGSLRSCSHYSLYPIGKREPLLKFNMPHVKTLPLEWLIKCIEKFELVDPTTL